MAALNGYLMAGVVALALAGALAGFLRYNLPPASVYLGDCGSMLVGLIVAAVAVQTSVKSNAVVMIAPASLLVLPLLDTTAAIVRRQLSGRGWATADRDHLHHVLLRGGLTVRRALLLVAALGIVAATGAVVGIRYRNDLISLITAGGVVLMLVASGLFGSAELRLIRRRAAAALAAARGKAPTVVEVRVADRTHWPEVWTAVTASAERLGLQSLALDTFDGREPFRQDWSNGDPGAGSGSLWRAELCLRDQGLPAARVSVTGAWDAEPVAAKLAALARVIEATAADDLPVLTVAAPASA
jgi:UDP-GlcNAc:undecaprenyl-phosphate GlcNAc-1-phosphate transferase